MLIVLEVPRSLKLLPELYKIIIKPEKQERHFRWFRSALARKLLIYVSVYFFRYE